MVRIELAADGRAWVDDHPLPPQQDISEARRAAIEYAVDLARERGYRLPAVATDPDGETWRLTVYPSGEIAQGVASEEGGYGCPAELEAARAAVVAAAVTGDVAAAREQAGGLEERAAALFGPAHPVRWRAAELRAHIGVLAGDVEAGVRGYLEAARGWLELDDVAEFWSAAQRAYAVWVTVADPVAATVVGEELAALLRERSGARWLVVRRQVLEGLDRLGAHLAVL